MPATPPVGYMSVIPRGLLSFLEIKNDAKYPQYLADFLQPVIDLKDWLLNTNESETLSGSAGSIGFVQIAVLNVRTWAFVTKHSVQTDDLGVGDSIEGALAVQTQPGITNSEFYPAPQVGAMQLYSQAAGDVRGLWGARGFWCPPGSAIGLRVTRFAGAIQLSQTLRFAPLPV